MTEKLTKNLTTNFLYLKKMPKSLILFIIPHHIIYNAIRRSQSHLEGGFSIQNPVLNFLIPFLLIDVLMVGTQQRSHVVEAQEAHGLLHQVDAGHLELHLVFVLGEVVEVVVEDGQQKFQGVSVAHVHIENLLVFLYLYFGSQEPGQESAVVGEGFGVHGGEEEGRFAEDVFVYFEDELEFGRSAEI